MELLITPIVDKLHLDFVSLVYFILKVTATFKDFLEICVNGDNAASLVLLMLIRGVTLPALKGLRSL